MKIFYKPAFSYLFVDIIMLVVWVFIILEWFPLTTNTPFDKYSLPSLYYIITWGIWSYLLGRYQPLRKERYIKSTNKLFFTSLIVLIFFHFIVLLFLLNKFSNNVLLTITVGEFSFNYFLLTIYFSYRYAIEYEDIIVLKSEERLNSKGLPENPLNQRSLEDIFSAVRLYTGECGLKYLSKNVHFEDGNTFVYASTEPQVLRSIQDYRYSTIIQLEKLNKIRGINKLFCTANKALPDEGILICCFESKSTHKKCLLNKYSIGINYMLYSFDYLINRFFPKLFFTRWLYCLTKGNINRILSKAEVYGRLYCCGFKIEKEKKVGQLNYVFARRIKEPETFTNRIYGPLIRLKRYGKNGKSFEVYKLRTMHPYSEYLQTYIYERNQLKDGGKFNKDIRVTTLGKFMRRFWLDEFPMLLNLLKGDMKLVGVRPLSQQYFNLYKKELQEKRINFKPGLLPPFYADLPKTLEEIQQSEMRYLTLCETNNTFQTDMYYLMLILKNILFRKARSC